MIEATLLAFIATVVTIAAGAAVAYTMECVETRWGGLAPLAIVFLVLFVGSFLTFYLGM